MMPELERSRCEQPEPIGAEDDLLSRLEEKRLQIERRTLARRGADRRPDQPEDTPRSDAANEVPRAPGDRRIAKRRQPPPAD
jgi:hypothetical protein